jgi:hypothetical protein
LAKKFSKNNLNRTIHKEIMVLKVPGKHLARKRNYDATVRKKPMREPKNLDEYERKTGISIEAICEDMITFAKKDPYQSMKNSVQSIKELVKTSQGEGMQFFFPLTGMRNPGTFVKGILRVVAPKAKVTFLVTPSVNRSSSKFLEEHIRKSRSPSCKKFFIVDFRFAGDTEQAIRKHLPENTEFVPLQRISLAEFTQVLDKKKTGEFSLGGGNLLNYAMKNIEFSNRRDFKYLWEIPIQNLKEYLTESEIRHCVTKSKIRQRNREMWQPITIGWLAEFVKDFPAERRKQIIKKMNKDDAITRKALYYLGMAAARSYT